jgi:predicted RNA-binding Zn-ribbon protein involved in translation (DUF1610 family)
MISSGVASGCPACGSSTIHPSRLRSILERIRLACTEKQPYRCHACGFRGWYPIDVPIARGPDAGPEQLRTGATSRPITADDLDRLDRR